MPDGADFESDPLGPRYRLRGNKMWISNGEHELTENIVHLVLAKIPGRRRQAGRRARAASRSSSCRRSWSTPTAQLTGERNDVALAGLNHKLGYRGITEHAAQLRRGQVPGARRGRARSATSSASRGEGLRCMFHMMNEARIAVGLGATMLGFAGYEASLDYAKSAAAGPADRARRQGRGASRRCASSSTPTSSACCWRRRATAKARWRSSCTARAWSTSCTPATTTAAARAHLLLEVLTPIAKSWPSEWCLEANSLAIQVLGGYGYTRDFPVEQYWRDNRLNMIHEGTHGIQALDLLGRKVVMDGGAGLTLRRDAIARPSRAAHALRARLARRARATARRGAANALLQAFGHVGLDLARRRAAPRAMRSASAAAATCSADRRWLASLARAAAATLSATVGR